MLPPNFSRRFLKKQGSPQIQIKVVSKWNHEQLFLFILQSLEKQCAMGNSAVVVLLVDLSYTSFLLLIWAYIFLALQTLL